MAWDKCNVPNWLTKSRMWFFAPMSANFLYCDFYMAALVLFLLGGVTDILDGFLARIWNCPSDWGSKWDPVADKILCDPLLLLLCWHFLDDQMFLTSAFIVFLYDIVVTWVLWNRRTEGGVTTLPIAKLKTLVLSIGIALLIASLSSRNAELASAGKYLTLAAAALVILAGIGYSFSLARVIMRTTTVVK